jgi:hypothetical protein
MLSFRRSDAKKKEKIVDLINYTTKNSKPWLAHNITVSRCRCGGKNLADSSGLSQRGPRGSQDPTLQLRGL